MDAGGKKPVSYGVGGSRGRIIFLGDGTEVLTGSDDIELDDNADEAEYLRNQGPGESEEASKETTTTAADKTDKTQTDKTQTDSTTKDTKE
jgi:protein phosphatase 2C family protein 2/3